MIQNMTLRYFDCRHRAEIEDICHSACRELELEVKLRQTEEEWTEQVTLPSMSSSTAHFPTSTWGRCFRRVASTQPGLAPPSPTVPSPSSPHLHRPSSSASVLLSFSSTSILITVFNTYSSFNHLYVLEYFFLEYLSHFRCPSNYFSPYSVHLSNTTQASQHPNFCHIQLHRS